MQYSAGMRHGSARWFILSAIPGAIRGVALGTALAMTACAPAPARAPAPAAPGAAAGEPRPAGLSELGDGKGCGLDAMPAADRPTWMLGHWVREDGRGSETWLAAGPGLLGIGFVTTNAGASWFEPLIIEEVGGVLTYTGIPGGQQAVDFALVESGPMSVVFANPAHDHPQRIRYQRRDDMLLAEVESALQGREQFAWKRAEPASATALEDADRAFAADSATRGAEAWAAVFAPDGVIWRRGQPPAVGPQAIGESMQRAFADPEILLAWEPVGGVLAPAGDMGFTVGCYQLVRRKPGLSPVREESGTYVTIWRRQADGSWKVVFDTGIASPSP
jgi:ketosteroid isomerase-like protein